MIENNESKSSGSNNSVSWGTKAKYVGVGILIGVVVAPLARKALSKLQPRGGNPFDHLTGKTEEFAEKASDLLARAKGNMHSEQHNHTVSESSME